MPSEKLTIFQTALSRKSWNACVLEHTPYAWILGFMQATACCGGGIKVFLVIYRFW
ncbi:hypothetical protein [Neisseria meningitidis]|uniref:hypothetical protein n=1 Tax=Neisseria meningitidis TaxID=487 RepID=UPI0013DEE43D|nr:hypothetical protein [Neisseria meningitidis]